MRYAKLTALLTIILATGIHAAEVKLHQVTFPERNNIRIEFSRTNEAPEAEVRAVIEYQEGRAGIDLDFDDMKPAILFGGDVTSFVMWAVPRAGKAENLGEVWVRKDRGKGSFSTALKSFALLITAEPYPLVRRPSELVMFTSLPAKTKKAPHEEFVFSDFAEAPSKDYPSIARVEWRKDRNLDLEQARKACELAERIGALDYAAGLMGEASIALAQATTLATKPSKAKATIDYSRRAVDTCAEAIRVTRNRKETEALEAEFEARKAEMAALEDRASEAEVAVAAATASLTDAEARQVTAEAAILAAQGRVEDMEQQTEALKLQKTTLEQEKMTLEQQKTALEQEKIGLENQKLTLEQQKSGLEHEKEDLSARLQGALSKVADTTSGARGMIVNLPDILFSTNEAELKSEAKIVIAKLAGILLIMPELNLRVEGHTDSTGSDDWNRTLSQKRA
ncbi:MAG: OmpA family protein, partial [Thermoanaerobaculales bacterium]|nr:OmpA family protein [Thermoanaerobaculales bacterium]